MKETICEYPNFTDLIEALLELKEEALDRLKEKCHIRVGIPLKPMLAKPTKGVQIILARFEGIPFTCEYKYDGFRGQMHYDRSKNLVNVFSRNLEDMTVTYPDAIEFL